MALLGSTLAREGARHLYTCYLRPFFLSHQARVDLIVGSASGEIVKLKLITAYQAEIQATRALFTKIMASVDEILRGEVTSVQPQSP